MVCGIKALMLFIQCNSINALGDFFSNSNKIGAIFYFFKICPTFSRRFKMYMTFFLKLSLPGNDKFIFCVLIHLTILFYYLIS